MTRPDRDAIFSGGRPTTREEYAAPSGWPGVGRGRRIILLRLTHPSVRIVRMFPSSSSCPSCAGCARRFAPGLSPGNRSENHDPRSRNVRNGLTLITAAMFFTGAAAAGDAPAGGGRVNNLKVLSDKIDDVTTAENVLKSFVRPGMSDADRARALWTAAVKYRHQTAPPNEHLAADWEAHDPVKLFNVYGYCMCCCSSALIEALNRFDGREARGRILNGHSVPEVFYGGGWHMYDASLLTFFPKPGTGEAASVDDISAAIAAWYAQNPGYRKNRAKLAELMRSEGWLGWKSKGPALLANCPYYHLGFFPARTHGWNDTMAEYDRKSAVYEYGYHLGHRALFSLRPGESLVREAGNRGLHVNMREAPAWEGLKARAPQGDLVYLKDF